MVTKGEWGALYSSSYSDVTMLTLGVHNVTVHSAGTPGIESRTSSPTLARETSSSRVSNCGRGLQNVTRPVVAPRYDLCRRQPSGSFPRFARVVFP